MTSDVPQHGVGVIGAGPFGHHLFERLMLRDDLKAVAAWFGERSAHQPQAECTVHQQPQAVIEDARTQIVYFAEVASRELVEFAIQHRKSVVLATTTGLSSRDLSQIAELAASQGTIAVLDEPHRWDDDFLSAKSVFDSGGLGQLERLRLSIHETALPGETFPDGILRGLGFHWLDQLLVFVSAQPRAVRLRRFCESGGTIDSGFLATIDFADGASAVIELQLASLLSLRTGWLLEGAMGAYRAGRRYSKTLDGEIIDEPVSVATSVDDPFFDNLAQAIAGDNSALSTLVTLTHAARVTALIESLEIPD
jgi:scyllo-inositol 2-dehydrogenase (NADP+)